MVLRNVENNGPSTSFSLTVSPFVLCVIHLLYKVSMLSIHKIVLELPLFTEASDRMTTFKNNHVIIVI